MRRTLAAGLTTSLALVLAACGSDGGSTEQPPRERSSATVSEPAEPKPAETTQDPSGSVLRFTMDRLNGDTENLAKYEGKVVLVVNTASECGFTPQFDGLENLYEQKRKEGFVILGFPADDVANQEPLTDEQIEGFCKANFGVTFPMFAKVNALGDDAAPLFKALPPPTWNFNKYLLDRNGRLVRNWGPETTPEDAELTGAIDTQLAKS